MFFVNYRSTKYTELVQLRSRSMSEEEGGNDSLLEEISALCATLLQAGSFVLGLDKCESHYVQKLLRRLASIDEKELLISWGNVYYLQEPKKSLFDQVFEDNSEHSLQLVPHVDTVILLNRKRLIPMLELMCIIMK